MEQVEQMNVITPPDGVYPLEMCDAYVTVCKLKYKVHRVILASRSQKWKEVFSSDAPFRDKEDELPIYKLSFKQTDPKDVGEGVLDRIALNLLNLAYQWKEWTPTKDITLMETIYMVALAIDANIKVEGQPALHEIISEKLVSMKLDDKNSAMSHLLAFRLWHDLSYGVVRSFLVCYYIRSVVLDDVIKFCHKWNDSDKKNLAIQIYNTFITSGAAALQTRDYAKIPLVEGEWKIRSMEEKAKYYAIYASDTKGAQAIICIYNGVYIDNKLPLFCMPKDGMKGMAIGFDTKQNLPARRAVMKVSYTMGPELKLLSHLTFGVYADQAYAVSYSPLSNTLTPNFHERNQQISMSITSGDGPTSYTFTALVPMETRTKHLVGTKYFVRAILSPPTFDMAAQARIPLMWASPIKHLSSILSKAMAPPKPEEQPKDPKVQEALKSLLNAEPTEAQRSLMYSRYLGDKRGEKRRSPSPENKEEEEEPNKKSKNSLLPDECPDTL